MIDGQGRVIVSNSTLRDVATCTTADVLRHAVGVTGTDTNGKRTLGVHVHDPFMTTFLRTGGNLKEALNLFRISYKPFSDQVCVPEKKEKDGVIYVDANPARWENASVVLEEWGAAHASLPYDVDPTLVEVSFLLPLGSRWIRGRLDALVRDEHGLWVHDTKTTGRLDANFWRQYRMDSALTGYCWAAEQTLGESIRGVIVEGIQMSEIPQSARKCTKHGVHFAECGRLHAKWGMERFERTAGEIADWYATTSTLAAKHEATMLDCMGDGRGAAVDLVSVPQEGKFHGACYKYEGFVACDFAALCEAGRPAAFSPELFGLEAVRAH